MKRIVQAVPYFPPAISGVGDYALLLARELRRAHDIQTIFVVGNPDWNKAESARPKAEVELEGFKIFRVKERSAAELLRVLSQPEMPATVLLQYAGYGYEKRGCPRWLVRALQSWKLGKQIPNFQLPTPISHTLVTTFHELYAVGPPWRSSFWTSLWQRRIAARLAGLSDHCVTNLRRNVRLLRRMTGRGEADFTAMPVLSNVGEPEPLPEWKERQPKMIVFGNARRRREIYSKHRAALEKSCRRLGLAEIVDIGPPCELPPLSVPCTPTGSLPPDEVSRLMLSARAGFFALPVEFLGKSGIFAAYAAHGLAPVTHAINKNANEDGLKPGEHFLTLDQLIRLNANDVRQISFKVREWYRSHESHAQAASYAAVIRNLAGHREILVSEPSFLR